MQLLRGSLSPLDARGTESRLSKILPVRVFSGATEGTQPQLPDRPEPAGGGPTYPRRPIPTAGKRTGASMSNFLTGRKPVRPGGTATAPGGALPFSLPPPTQGCGTGWTEFGDQLSPPPALAFANPTSGHSPLAPGWPGLTSHFSVLR